MDSSGIPADVAALCDQATSSQRQKELPDSISYWIELLGKYDVHDKARDENECTSERCFLETSQQALCHLLVKWLVRLGRINGQLGDDDVVAKDLQCSSNVRGRLPS